MQIVRTEVTNATAGSGHPVLRVTFCGEGGECVTVDMANPGDGSPDRQAALSRAKAILIQTASFGLAVNEYDAASSGNFDEIAMTSASNGDGDVYIFEYRDGETSRSVPPSTMPSLDAARAEAVRCAVDLLADLQPGRDDLTGWLVRLRNQRGDLLVSVDVAEAEAARKSDEMS